MIIKDFAKEVIEIEPYKQDSGCSFLCGLEVSLTFDDALQILNEAVEAIIQNAPFNFDPNFYV